MHLRSTVKRSTSQNRMLARLNGHTFMKFLEAMEMVDLYDPEGD